MNRSQRISPAARLLWVLVPEPVPPPSKPQKSWATLKQGDPMAPETALGPMVDDTAVERTRRWVAEAVADGARERHLLRHHAAQLGGDQLLGALEARAAAPAPTTRLDAGHVDHHLALRGHQEGGVGDPVLERTDDLLAEEEEIERTTREHHETPHFRPGDD